MSYDIWKTTEPEERQSLQAKYSEADLSRLEAKLDAILELLAFAPRPCSEWYAEQCQSAANIEPALPLEFGKP